MRRTLREIDRGHDDKIDGLDRVLVVARDAERTVHLDGGLVHLPEEVLREQVPRQRRCWVELSTVAQHFGCGRQSARRDYGEQGRAAHVASPPRKALPQRRWPRSLHVKAPGWQAACPS